MLNVVFKVSPKRKIFSISVNDVELLHEFNKTILIGWFMEILCDKDQEEYYMFTPALTKQFYTKEDYRSILRVCLAHAMRSQHGY